MKKLLLASVASLALSTPLLAADYAPVPQFSWTGVYVGGTLGYGWAKNDGKLKCNSIQITGIGGTGANSGPGPDDCANWTEDYNFELFEGDVVSGPNTGNTYPAFEFPSGDYISLQGTRQHEDGGLIGGAILGVNLQYEGFVIGFEGDFVGTGAKGESVSEFGHFGSDEAVGGGQSGDGLLAEFAGEGRINIRDEMDWLSTARMRVGHTLGDSGRVMAYGTVGLALAQVSRSASTQYDEANPLPAGKCDLPNDNCGFFNNDLPAGIRFKDQFYQAGYVLGGGVAWAVTDNIIVGAEYLFTEFLDTGGSVSTRFQGDAQDKKMEIDIDDIGFNSVQQARARVVFKF